VTTYELRKSGLVAPVSPKKPTPKRGPLEIEWDSDRERAHGALQAMVHLLGCRLAPDRDKREWQMRAVLHLAEQLLGKDVVFEEKT